MTRTASSRAGVAGDTTTATSERHARGRTVADPMKREVIAISPNASLLDLIRVMRDQNIGDAAQRQIAAAEQRLLLDEARHGLEHAQRADRGAMPPSYVVSRASNPRTWG